MARIVKEHEERFNEIVDTAQVLFFSHGYEQTSVQDIINHIGVAKGTFYHYFESKVDLLDAVIKRSRTRILAIIQPIVEDPERDALTKFKQLFREVSNWKFENHDVILDMLRKLFTDENVLLRLKVLEDSRLTMTGPLAAIIEQGVGEGSFRVEYARETAELVLRICEMPSRGLLSALIEQQYDEAQVETIKREIYVFNRSIEHVLGMAKGTIDLITDADLSGWLSVLERLEVDSARSE